MHFYTCRVRWHQQLLLGRMEVADTYKYKNVWVDEAHCYMNGIVYTRNSKIWSSVSPNCIHEIIPYSTNITVWFGYTANFKLFPYSFRRHGQHDSNAFGSGQIYLCILQTVVIPQLQHRQCLSETNFQARWSLAL